MQVGTAKRVSNSVGERSHAGANEDILGKSWLSFLTKFMFRCKEGERGKSFS